MSQRLQKVLRIFNTTMIVLAIGALIYIVRESKMNVRDTALAILESGYLDVYDQSGKLIGYVEVSSSVANFDEYTVDVKGVLHIQIPEDCTPIFLYEWPKLSIACLNGPTTNTTLGTKDTMIRILTDKIEAIKK